MKGITMGIEKKEVKAFSLYDLSKEMQFINKVDPQWNVDWDTIKFDDFEGNAKLTIFKEIKDEIIDCPICQGFGYLDRECERICDLCDGDLRISVAEYEAYLEMMSSEEI